MWRTIVDDKKTEQDADVQPADENRDQENASDLAIKKEANVDTEQSKNTAAGLAKEDEAAEVADHTSSEELSSTQVADETTTPSVLAVEQEPTTGSIEPEGSSKDSELSTLAVATPTVPHAAAAVISDTTVTQDSSIPRRKKLILVIALAAVVLLAVVAIALKMTLWNNSATLKESTEASTQKAAKLGVAVTLVDGEATYRRGTGEWKPVTIATQLQEGDDVRTAASGRVVLTFDDGSALRLDYASTVTLASLAAKDIRVTQTAGTAYSRVVASDRSYIVTIDTVKYQALGTAFVTVNSADEKGVQVYQSKVKVDGVAEAVGEGKQYYKQHKTEALKGKMSDLDVDTLASNEFVDWNTTEDEKSDKFKERLGILKTIRERRELAREAAEKLAQTAPRQSTATIQLRGSSSDKGAALSWTVSGVEVASGFKIVRSASTQTPTFGRDDAVYIDKSAARTYTWSTKKAGTYWYRVCAYRPASGECVQYSNAVSVTTTATTAGSHDSGEKVTRGTMTLSVDASGSASWNYTGSAVHGYKIVMSKTQNPIYPDNSVAYFDHHATSGVISLKTGTYYIRVCAWTNGSESEPCVDYSNQVTITKN